MARSSSVDPPGPVARRALRRRAGLIGAGVLLVFAGVVAGFGAWLGSESLLRLIAERAVIASAGRLTIEAPGGSLLGSMKAKRVLWHDGPLTLAVDDAVLALGWRSLLQRRVVLQTLSASHVEVVTEPSDAPAAPPASLRSPVRIEIVDARIDGLVLRQVGDDTPLRLDDLRAALHYDRRTWTVDTLSLGGPFGRVEAGGTIADAAPFALSARLLLQTEALGEPVTVGATMAGDLSTLEVDLRSVLRDASLSARAGLRPFAPQPLAALRATVSGLDLRRFGEALPSTHIEATFDGQAATERASGASRLPPLAGMLRLRNASPGAVDTARLPVETLESRVSVAGERVRFDGLTLAGPPGRLSGSASVALPAGAAGGGAPLDFDLRLATEALDLSRAYTGLLPTALKGALHLRPDRGGLAFDTRLADREMVLEATARLADDLLTLSSASLRVRDGVAQVRGTVGTVAPFRFDLSGQLARLDPARFADVPAGLLNGDWSAKGQVGPALTADIALSLAASRWRGLPLAGRAAMRYEPERLRRVDAALTLGASTLAARGELGAPGDRLTVSLDAARLQQLDPRLAGRLSIDAELRDALRTPAIGATVRAGEFRLAERLSLRTLQARIDLPRLDAVVAALDEAGVPGLAGLAGALTGAVPPGAPPARTVSKPVSPRPLGGPAGVTLQAEGLRADGVALDSLRAEFAGTVARHLLTLRAVDKARTLDARVGLEGGFSADGAGRWTGRLVELANAGTPSVRLRAPAELAFDFAADAPAVSLTALQLEVDGADGARVQLDKADWRDGRAALAGRVTGIPLRWLSAFGGGTGTGLRLEEPDGLRVGGRIDIAGLPGPGGGLTGFVELARESGDVAVEVAAVDGGTEVIRAGLQTLQARLEIADDRIRANVAIRGSAVGEIRGDAQAPLAWVAQGRVPDLAVPLEGRLELDVPSLAFTRAVTGEAWRFDGALQARLALAGSIASPRISGRLAGSRLVAEQRELGMRLSDGELVATVRDNLLDIEVLRFASGQGSVSMSGTLRPDERSEAVLTLERMPIPLGAGQRLILSGEARARLSGGVLALRGSLRADEGVIELTGNDAPRLARDVVVVRNTAEAVRHRAEVERRRAEALARGRAPAGTADAARGAGERPPPTGEEGRGFRILSNLEIDLGERFRVFGGGIDARLAGQVTLRGRLPDAPRLTGTVRVVQGTYTGFGQNLAIERGELVFSGPVDNPAIDIVAYRRFLPVEAGVSLTGTARAPNLALVSKPDVPEQEKLSWLVLGVGVDTARSGGQSAALQTAAATLLAAADPSMSGPGFASSLGLDVLSVRTGQVGSSGDSGSSATSAQDSIVTIGKRLSDRLFISYEQSLRGLQNLLRLQYEITERLSVRTRVGSQNAVDLSWTRRYD
jgi:translocation and assembly module TamB